MAWDKTIPDDDELLINFPALCRANWSALEDLTDSALQITNAKVASTANISDTKLAQITTPGKVSGAALTSLGSIPSGAGTIPDANSNNKLSANSADSSPEYLDGLINISQFQIASDKLELKDGGVETEKLESGSASPGNSKYYGTNSSGTKGFFDLPTQAGCKARLSSNQSISASTNTKIQFDTTDYDEKSEWDSANYKYTAGSKGKRVVSIVTDITSFSGSYYILKIYKNGSMYAYMTSKTAANTLTVIVDLNASDTIEFYTEGDSSYVISADTTRNIAMIQKISQ